MSFFSLFLLSAIFSLLIGCLNCVTNIKDLGCLNCVTNIKDREKKSFTKSKRTKKNRVPNLNYSFSENFEKNR